MKKKLRFLILILLFVCAIAEAQHPVYTQLTEKDGLPDIEFYDIVEDKDGFIWLAANKGLFRYDGKEFKNYTNSQKRGLSVFGLKFDSRGRLWCNNISGQFFYVENDELILFKDLKDQFRVLATFFFLNDTIQISGNSKLVQIPINESQTVKRLFGDNKLCQVAYKVNDDLSFIVWDKYKKQYSVEELNSPKKIDLTKYSNLNLDKWRKFSLKASHFLVAYDPNNIHQKKLLFYLKNNSFKELYFPEKLENNAVITIYENNNSLWFCTLKGVFVYRFINEELVYETTYFKGKEVTKVVKDIYNNYWFTTLRDGLYVISNIAIKKYTLPKEQHNITAMVKVNDSLIMTGSTNGSVVILNKNNNKIKRLKNYERYGKIFSIGTVKDKAYLSFAENSIVYDTKSGKVDADFYPITNAKDIATINEESLLFGNHQGSYVVSSKNGKFKRLRKNRVYSTHYNSTTKSSYIGYVNGLFKYDENFNETPIFYNNAPIYAKRICNTNTGIVWVSTFKKGLLGIKNDTVFKHFTIKNGLLSNQTGIVENDDNGLWIASDKGLQFLDTNTDKFKNLTKKEGINSFNITAIILFKNTLFYSSNNGVFKIDKKEVFDNANRNLSDFYFTSISINEEDVVLKNSYVLKPETRKIQVKFHTNGFFSGDDIMYKYRLLGASENWEVIPKNLGLVTFNNLAPGSYSFELKACDFNDNKSTRTKSIKFTIKSPIYQRLWFVVLLIVFTGLCIWYAVRLRIQQLHKKQKIALEKERMQKQLASSQLESLQAQMNPHFTFNALNSIQNLVLKGNKYEAYDYLNKFSALIRENLNMSRKGLVTFNEEVNMLTKYLDLEQLRFRDNFSYEIIGEDKIEDIQIPSMIIQPYIENAIKHGLLHKTDGAKKLTIEFKQEDVLKCTITDNGVGIKVSQKIKKESGASRVSFSTVAINEKMRFLKEYYKTDIGVVYKNVPIGTKVIIKIPFTI